MSIGKINKIATYIYEWTCKNCKRAGLKSHDRKSVQRAKRRHAKYGCK